MTQQLPGLWFGAVLALVIACAGCSNPEGQPPASENTSAAAPERVPLGQLPDVDIAGVLAHTRVLSSDEFEGRAPASKGEERTVAYLIDQFKKAGLKPGNTDGTYIQKVPLVGITVNPAPLIVRRGARQETLKWRDDVVAWTKHVEPRVAIKDSELVFVGYGVVAPEFEWDDYKGMDVKGKTLVMLVNDPPVADAANPGQLDPKAFGGRAMTYYGRWTYKFEIGAQKGAAAVLVVHETGPAGYPFQVVQDGFTGERFDLVTPGKNLGRSPIEAWISLDQARKLLQMAGQDFDTLKQQAATRDFTPVPLGTTASMTLDSKLRTVDSQNVLGTLEGSDPVRKDEYIVYSAHWDHLGKDPSMQGDQIFNGALDNASGVATMLEVAEAFAKLPEKPERSILFLAVTAEEKGLLGAKYYAENPLYPLGKTLANINMDGINQWGRTSDVVVVGLGNSTLDDVLAEAASTQSRTLEPDAEPEKGFYYRSDHFEFAKQGVPALYTHAATDYIGKPEGYGQQKRDDFTANHYHKVSDEVRPDWDLTGAVEDAQLMFQVGYRVSRQAEWPAWKPGVEFKARREQMLGTAETSK